MKYATTIVLLGVVTLLSACSYATDFVVVNQSEKALDVQYRVKDFPGAFVLPEIPATVPSSQLSTKGSQQWSKLGSERYQVDPQNRTVSIRLLPGEALLVARIHNYAGHEDAWGAKEFPLSQLTVKGTNGEISLNNEQTRTSFSEVSKALYTLTYK
jgi:hypothetical protein